MKKILLAATVLLAAFAWSCKKEEKVTDAVTIKTDETIVSVEGGVVSIALNATVAWTAKSSQNCLSDSWDMLSRFAFQSSFQFMRSIVSAPFFYHIDQIP